MPLDMYVSYIFILSSIGLDLCGLDSYECLCVWVDYIHYKILLKMKVMPRFPLDDWNKLWGIFFQIKEFKIVLCQWRQNL